MTHTYSEGNVFFVPLRSGGFARGVVARSSKYGKVLFGYFFGPCLSSTDSPDVSNLVPTQAILRLRCGDLALIKGEWPIWGKIPKWNREEWPMPDFIRRDPLGKKKSVIVRYLDSNPSEVESEQPINSDVELENDVMSGHGAIEVKLSKLLAN